MNLSNKHIIQEGDLVILYERKDSLIPLYMKKGDKYNCIFGSFLHDSMIGQPYGSTIRCVNGNRYMYVLAPTSELWSGCMKTRTQIIFTMDASVILFNLFIKPGCRVVESGTGSGALSTSFARAIFPLGHLFTFEYNEMRVEEARKEFERNGFGGIISVFSRDAYEDGFEVKNEDETLCVDAEHTVDAVFLDLPKPYNAIKHAHHVLKRNGRICCFSPCIEQVQENCKSLRSFGFELIETIEVLIREHELNTIDNNNSYTTRNRTTQKKNEKMEEENSPEAPTSDAADSLKREQTREDSANPLFVPSKSIYESLSTMVLAKGEHIGRGHTAYLTFATKMR